jgi:hypothetical protein
MTREHGSHPLDPELAIVWPGDVEPILPGHPVTALPGR